MTTSLDALRAAQSRLDAAADCTDDTHGDRAPETCSACRALDAAEEAVGAARSALAASDEPRAYEIRCDGGYATLVGRPSQIDDVVSDWLVDGDWDRSSVTWADAHYHDVDTCPENHHGQCRCEGDVSVSIPAEEPPCDRGQDHDWQAPYTLVGGAPENPGVRGHGGGVVISEACIRCGCGRTTDTWAQRPDTGEMVGTVVSYCPDAYDAEDLSRLAEVE